MPRINHVKKAQKDQGTCGGCSKPIKKGEPYKWIKFRFGGKRKRCESCTFRASDLTNSDKLSRVYGAQETAQDALSEVTYDEVSCDASEVKEILSDAASEIREVGEEYQESCDNIMEHFPSGNSTSEECEEKANELEGWADELEGWEPNDGEFEESENEFDEDTIERKDPSRLENEPDGAYETRCEEVHEGRVESARTEWEQEYETTHGYSADEARSNYGEACVSEATEAIDNCPI